MCGLCQRNSICNSSAATVVQHSDNFLLISLVFDSLPLSKTRSSIMANVSYVFHGIKAIFTPHFHDWHEKHGYIMGNEKVKTDDVTFEQIKNYPDDLVTPQNKKEIVDYFQKGYNKIRAKYDSLGKSGASTLIIKSIEISLTPD
jgi:hypothetical protein